MVAGHEGGGDQAGVGLDRRLHDPATQKRLTDLGLDVAAKDQQTPDGLAAFNKAEIDKWWPIMKAAGIKPE